MNLMWRYQLWRQRRSEAKRAAGMPTLTAIKTPLDMSPAAFGELQAANHELHDMTALRQRMGRDGYVFLRDFLPPQEVLEARRQVLTWLAHVGMLQERTDLMEAIAAPHATTAVVPENCRFPTVRRLTHSGRLLEFYTAFLEGQVRVYDYIWLRLMSPGGVTGPHCDIVYMGRGTTNLYTAWIPLGDVPLHHGALLILEGSHRIARLRQGYGRIDIDRGRNWTRPRFRHGRLFRGGDYSRNPRAVQRRFKRRWLSADFRLGDVVLFSAYTLHGSLDNVSRHLRLSVDTRYQLHSEPVDERWVGEHPMGHTKPARSRRGWDEHGEPVP